MTAAGADPPPVRPPDTIWWRRLLAARWLLLVLGSTLALILFGAVGDEVLEPGSNVVDRVLRAWVLAHQSWPALDIAHVLTDVGSPGATVALGLAVTAWLWIRRRRAVAATVLAAPIAAAGAFAGLKAIFGRARPAGALEAHLTTYAFPSGHATVSAAVWLAIAYCLRREGLIPRMLAIALGLGWPLVIGLTRVYLDVHWATDVIGGWCLGAAVAALAGGLYERTRGSVAPRTSAPR
jgi:undecaprenyl-diphosphatase